MPHPKPKPFAPPKPEQVRKYLRRHPPTGAPRWLSLMPMFSLGLLLVLLLMVQETALLLVMAWLILGGLFALLGWRVRQMQELEARVNHASDLAVLNRFPESLRLAWRTLPVATRSPEMHGRLVALIAHDLDQAGACESAITAYTYLLDNMPPNHPSAVQVKIHRAMAQLTNDQLTDADDALRRLRGAIEPYKGSPLAALYRLANLIQQVRTLHFEDAVTHAPTLVDELRPLGVSAGLGHALMAWSYRNLPGAAEPGSPFRAEADSWWGRATLLLPVETILRRFKELTPMAETTTGDPTQAPA
ncbi:MAG: hypothetical protein K8S99_14010 [Planctomycetes bacterium]|nr:hypothetical protein [Planctomycetota bacterium]